MRPQVTSRRRPRPARLLVAVPVVVAALAGSLLPWCDRPPARTTSWSSWAGSCMDEVLELPRPRRWRGRDRRDGTRGPSLEQSGEAAAYYYLSTGRMPLPNSEEQPTRKPHADQDEIEALVAYVGTLGDGPRIPGSTSPPATWRRAARSSAPTARRATAPRAAAAPSRGGRRPRLSDASPTEVAAAVRVGPGQMPVFGPETISDDELNGLVRYVEYLDDPDDPGGVPIGRTGPIPEGSWPGWWAWWRCWPWWRGSAPAARSAGEARERAPGERGARAQAAPSGKAAACFVVATVAAIALAVVYWEGGQPQAEGVLLALSLGGIGTGIVLWAKHFMPDDEVVGSARRSSRARRR